MAGPAGLEAFSVLELGPKSLRVKKVKKIGESSDPQKIVAEHELEDHLTEASQFVLVLPSQRIPVRR